MAKASVAPLKQLTLPKLELMAALTAARLSSFITNALKFCNCSINLWTDRQIILHCIKGEKRNNAFVTYRITEIHSITDLSYWRYCQTLDNPADLLTRGVNSTQLRSSTCGNMTTVVTILYQLANLATLTYSPATGTSCNKIRFHFTW